MDRIVYPFLWSLRVLNLTQIMSKFLIKYYARFSELGRAISANQDILKCYATIGSELSEVGMIMLWWPGRDQLRPRLHVK